MIILYYDFNMYCMLIMLIFGWGSIHIVNMFHFKAINIFHESILTFLKKIMNKYHLCCNWRTFIEYPKYFHVLFSMKEVPIIIWLKNMSRPNSRLLKQNNMYPDDNTPGHDLLIYPFTRIIVLMEHCKVAT